MRDQFEYVAFRKFDFKTLSGHTYEIPRGTRVKSYDGVLVAPNGEEICNVHSERGHQFFAWNGDGQGLLRGDLTYAIAHAPRKYRHGFRFNTTEQEELQDRYAHWLMPGGGLLFNDYFYHAPIDHLTNMASRFNISKEEIANIF